MQMVVDAEDPPQQSAGSATQAPQPPQAQVSYALPETSVDESVSATWSREPQNPYNWSSAKKSWVCFILLMAILNSCIASSLTSNAVQFIAEEFKIRSQSQRVLPQSTYLLGYVCGPILWAPTSEQFGRRNIAISTFCLYALFTMACALATSWASLLVFRLFTGIFASGPIAVVTGALADIYQSHRTRGRAIAIYMVVTAFGPLCGPIISGFVAPALGWRWSFWVALILAGATLPPLISLPETHGATLLAQRGLQPNKPIENENRNGAKFLSVLLLRPLHMLIFEPIVTATSVYLALVYAIFYMSFQAYPLIFQEMYKMSPGIGGLVYLTIGAGCLLFLPVFWLYDTLYLADFAGTQNFTEKATFLNPTRLIRGNREEYLRLPLACVGGPLFALSLFWLGWSARPATISFALPMIAGLPFGFGFICIFIALLYYVYGPYAASANAASTISRSLLGTVLPLATRPMFDAIGVSWGCSLLGALSVLMCAIPFLFLWKGEAIRGRSRFARLVRESKRGAVAPVVVQQQEPVPHAV
ncbi:major facilitator superfamily domain-containing protein [Aspergillus pseudoustus]|uniref:Major facilitator superfamily domain-containing protein n=1 Tax=Aspergillus pseudoustus TaxID=1810923 RepID=A0ABR4KCX8_9EURO